MMLKNVLQKMFQKDFIFSFYPYNIDILIPL